MGRGNIQIRDKHGWGVRTYYVEYFECGGEHGKFPCDCNDYFLIDLLTEIRFTIGSKLKTLEPVLIVNDTIRHIYDDFGQRVYFENEFMEVIIMDNEHNLAIACIPKLTSLNKNYSSRYVEKANSFMYQLNQIHPVTARTSPNTRTSVFSKNCKTFY